MRARRHLALELSEADGLVYTLAEPNLTALSGETASFLAGGEFLDPPSPAIGRLGTTTIEYKKLASALPTRRPCSPFR